MIEKATLIIVTIIGVSIIHYINNTIVTLYLQAAKVSFEQTSYNTDIRAAEITLPIMDIIDWIYLWRREVAFSICLFLMPLFLHHIFSWNQICRQHNRKIAHRFKILTIVVYLIWAWQKLQFKFILLPFLILEFIYCSCFCHCSSSIALPHCHLFRSGRREYYLFSTSKIVLYALFYKSNIDNSVKSCLDFRCSMPVFTWFHALICNHLLTILLE